MTLEDKNILEPIKEPAAKDINKNMQDNAAQVKKAARKFLSGIRTVLNKYNHIKTLQRSKKRGINTSLEKIYEAMQQSTKITQQCIKYQYKFEQSLNAFLGRKIFLLYITQDGKMLYGNEATAAKIYRTATVKKGKGSIKNIDQQQLETFPTEISQNFKSVLQHRELFYTPIRQQVIKRWTDNHNSNNPWVRGNEKLKDTFYWRVESNNPPWDWSKQINRGHIYEAYAHLVWENSQEEHFDPQQEKDIEKYWRYMETHKILNSVSGIVKGDVSFFKDPSIQFAVKSGSFNTAAIGSYIDVAYELAYGEIEITKEMIELLLDNLSSFSYQVRHQSLLKAEEGINKIVESIDGLKLN